MNVMQFKAAWPSLYDALESMAKDGGLTLKRDIAWEELNSAQFGRGWSNGGDNVGEFGAPLRLNRLDMACADLGAGLDQFCNGDPEDQEAMADRIDHGRELHAFLNECFDGDLTRFAYEG